VLETKSKSIPEDYELKQEIQIKPKIGAIIVPL
jgi:hypothetical protein